MTMMVDQIVGPDQAFHAGTTVSVRLVASLNGEGAGMDPANLRTIHGVADVRLASPLVALDLEPNESITIPTGTYYEVESRIMGTRPVRRTFSAPAEVAPTTTTSSFTVGGGPNLAASTTGFPSAGLLWVDGMLLAYTGKTSSAFTGVTGGVAGAVVASGTQVRQAVWIGSQITFPPTALPTLKADLVPFTPTGGIAATDVQAAIEEVAAAVPAPGSWVDTTTAQSVSGVKTFGGLVRVTGGISSTRRISAKGAGIAGDGTNQQANLNAWIATLDPAVHHTLMLEDGRYGLSHPVLANVSLEPENHYGATLVNLATDGGRFITFTRGCSVRGLVIDARRAAQPQGPGLSAGRAAIVFAKPAGLTGGGTSLAGGVTLSAALSANATSMAVVSAANILPGDVIGIVEGAVEEHVQVDKDYVVGNLTVPLVGKVVNSFTTAAKVSVCVTDAVVDDCLVYGEIQGQSMWDWRVTNTKIRDVADTALGMFDRGSVGALFADNDIETIGHWAIFIDAAATPHYPKTRDTRIVGGRLLFVPGYVDADGTPAPGVDAPVDAIGLNGCHNTTIEGVLIDLRQAGITGVRINPGTPDTRIGSGTRILGRGAAGSYGVADITLAGDDAKSGTVVDGAHIEGFNFGVDFGVQPKGVVRNSTLRDNTTHVNHSGARTDGQPCKLVATGNKFVGGTNGIRAYNTAPTGSYVQERANDYDGVTNRRVVDPSWATNPPTGETAVHGASVRRNAALSVPNTTLTVVSFDAPDWVAAGAWVVGAPDTITIKEPGLYQLQGAFGWSGPAAGRRIVDLLVNGSPVARWDVNTAGDFPIDPVVRTLPLAAGDTVQLRVYQGTGAPVNALVGAVYSCVLSATRLGPAPA